MGLLLGTMGYWFFGLQDIHLLHRVLRSAHGFDAMYHWMHVGRIGQWVLFLLYAGLCWLAWPTTAR